MQKENLSGNREGKTNTFKKTRVWWLQRKFLRVTELIDGNLEGFLLPKDAEE